MERRPIPSGTKDFRKVRELALDYVDKSDLIREVIDRRGVEVLVLLRPPRFGKSLNLSMLRCWFEKRDDDLSPLFEGLSIWQAGPDYRVHFQRYPVLYLSLEGTGAATFEGALAAIREKIGDLYRDHRAVLEGGKLDQAAARRFRQILDGTAEQTLYDRALLDLSRALHVHHGERVVLLVDDYDEPIVAGHVHGYSPRITAFVSVLLGEGLKGNTHLHKGVVTGIFRVATGDLTPSLDNAAVYTLFSRPFNAAFAPTEPGGARLAERPSSSSEDLVRKLLRLHAREIQPALEALLEGASLEVSLDRNLVLSDIRHGPRALWSLLVFAGYLDPGPASPRSPGHRLVRAARRPPP